MRYSVLRYQDVGGPSGGTWRSLKEWPKLPRPTLPNRKNISPLDIVLFSGLGCLWIIQWRFLLPRRAAR